MNACEVEVEVEDKLRPFKFCLEVRKANARDAVKSRLPRNRSGFGEPEFASVQERRMVSGTILPREPSRIQVGCEPVRFSVLDEPPARGPLKNRALGSCANLQPAVQEERPRSSSAGE